jgi:hypothetical protein
MHRETFEELRDDEMDFYKPGIVASPMLLIANTVPKRNTYSLGLVSCHNTDVEDNDMKSASERFGLNLNEPEGNFSTDGNFSYTSGTYNPKKRNISFSPYALDVMLEVEERK